MTTQSEMKTSFDNFISAEGGSILIWPFTREYTPGQNAYDEEALTSGTAYETSAMGFPPKRLGAYGSEQIYDQEGRVLQTDLNLFIKGSHSVNELTRYDIPSGGQTYCTVRIEKMPATGSPVVYQKIMLQALKPPGY